ncbi:uncharacterized protein PHACADRAFT_92278 [Phanerochaete carnosa HHB-10118-sp]|uniref:Uncharacterized protein n=1 Tax=Phanerochaete carnosa (strain HHB-10118-sp) TaxID=650164 RepID=K5WBH1_PHACS|nr:uncharacterized protein PHACADRAFT_92278 [Phanerochaete carnosa HHB-10118-sp]EKM56565.1 hypothetical protein PHACADRAFT_92278 [Phanerochaete carnosa HHB-10118-sp]
MFFSRRLPAAPDEIYSSCLATLYEGHAMWYPEPHVSGEPQIGDVGFIRKGAFVRLFNLDTSAPEKRVALWNPPFEVTEDLPPSLFMIDPRRCPLVPAHYPSHGVEVRQRGASVDITAAINVSATLGAEYTCKAAQGAVLELNSEADAESIYEKVSLKEYIIRHHNEWYAYAKDVLDLDIQRESIVVVIGWVKTEADWATVAFGNTSTSSSVSLEGRAAGVVGAGVGTSRSSSTTGPTMRRQGKDYSASAPDSARDQSVFLKRLKMKKRFGLLKEIVAGAGYHRLPDRGDGRGGSAAEGIAAREGDVEDIDEASIIELGSEGEVPDPLDVLLNYILEGGKSVVDFASYLRRVQPPVQVDDTCESLIYRQ